MTIRDRYPTAVKPKHFDRGTFEADEIKLFPPIVTEAEDLVGYLRTGGCTAGCGACCEAFVVPILPDGLKHEDFKGVVHGQIVLPIEPTARGKAGGDDWEYWLTLHGVYLFMSPGGLLTATVPIEANGEAPTDFDAWMTWLEEHGITFLQRHGQHVLAYLSIRCGKLTEDGMCGVFGTKERPQMCAPYPEHPLDIEGIDFCTYKFQPIKREQMIPLLERTKKPQPMKVKSKRKKRQSKKGRKRG